MLCKLYGRTVTGKNATSLEGQLQVSHPEIRVSVEGTTPLMVTLIIQGDHTYWTMHFFFELFFRILAIKIIEDEHKIIDGWLILLFCTTGTAFLTVFCFMQNVICSFLRTMRILLRKSKSIALSLKYFWTCEYKDKYNFIYTWYIVLYFCTNGTD